MNQPSILPPDQSVLRGDCWRITVLTDRLLRLEYSRQGQFPDSATQLAVNRHFPPVSFRVTEYEGKLVLTTSALRLTYDRRPFSPDGLMVEVNDRNSVFSAVWHYGDPPQDLLGTARTLDGADGPIPLEHGILSAEGWSVLSDRGSALMDETGAVSPRPDPEGEDLYFFGYGRDYLGCLRDFYRLTGPTPLLPRFALGNWWSRYYRYSQAEYLQLMDRFAAENLPFTVSVIDMDWHVTDVDPKYGTGWTGFTWNRDLFPDPDGFLQDLHRRGLRVTLNLHPADGVRAFEDCYKPFAAFMGVDQSHGDPIPFRLADPKFREGYFRFALRPLEDQGVDFWWIDWQQGTNSGAAGLDPLWLLNHFQYLDHAARHDRGLLFSRYAGPGSHRYPVGFSGDTLVTWESLDFQPYFTANASNIGYGWWSHDIGGHMGGFKDGEMALRWLQFGVFSPIMRLHSTNNRFNSKEPWRYGPEIAAAMGAFLRLRHRLIPYTYTMNRRAALESVPLCEPMYYRDPDQWEAYRVPNQYRFGSELLVCPITRPADRATGLGSVTAWLPQGRWVDFFTGLVYEGGRKLALHRPREVFPVLAKAGAIVPLDGRETGNDTGNPPVLELNVFAGADGSFSLWEDDGVGDGRDPARWAETVLTFTWGETARLTIAPARGNTAALPQNRSYRLRLVGMGSDCVLSAQADGAPLELQAVRYDAGTAAWTCTLPAADPAAALTVTAAHAALADNDVCGRAFALLDRAEISFDTKSAVMDRIEELNSGRSAASILGELLTMDLPGNLLPALSELLTAF